MPCLECEELELDIGQFPSLFLNVVFDCFAVPSITDGPHVVAIGPEFPSPELLFHGGDFEAALCRECFDPSNDISPGVCGKELAEDVDVIVIEPNVMNIDCKALLEAFEDIEDGIDDSRFQDSFAIFDRELDVIIAFGDIVVPPPHIPFDVRHGTRVAGCCSGL